MKFLSVLMVVLFFNFISIEKCFAAPLISMAREHQVRRKIKIDRSKIENLQKEYMQEKFKLQAKITKNLEEISIIMSQCGLTKKWQSEYFLLRGYRACEEGFYFIGGLYMDYAKKLK